MAFPRLASIFSRGSRYRPFLRDFSLTLFGIATWVPVCIFINQHVGELTFINGASMYPYLNTGYNNSTRKDIGYTSKWNSFHNLERGMIVTFWSPDHPEVLAVKRVIALPGDKVYTRAPYPYPTAIVPSGHVWVEGDNRDREASKDSNYYGPISMSLITGKVTHVLYPWSSFGSVKWWEFKGKTRVIKARE
ncbi:LexA peptidase [Coleophoma crateriformis]|uniref:Mitochondrial inner membrane protease subunit 2 n=1 Tax=Coleophoma crateriformis TaxID=565419 RepID=A0A3D8QQZ6_9HELO|nr:LexA peptidase [Coleophoma crateriformis]